MKKANPCMLLAIDSSPHGLLEHRIEFEKAGIGIHRVDTMYEAISQLIRGEEYICIVINEDSIPGFMTTLPIMGDVAKTPIYVTSHSDSKSKQIKAMFAGADAYVSFGETAKDDVYCCLLHLKLPSKWAKRVALIPPVLIGGDIILSKTRRCVYRANKEVKLTEKEFDILVLLMDNIGVTVTYEQISNYVWQRSTDNPSTNALSIHINRLRSKLLAAAPKYRHMIVNIPNLGYRFVEVDIKCN